MGQQMTSYRGRRLILHGGSVPGFKTQLARFPDDGLGIAVFVNEEVYGTQVHEVLQSTTADVALGLGEIDWSGRCVPFTFFHIAIPSLRPLTCSLHLARADTRPACLPHCRRLGRPLLARPIPPSRRRASRR